MDKIVGADIGYGYTKALSDGGKQVTFASVMGSAVKIRYENDLVTSGKNHHAYTVGDSTWFVGDFARLQCARAQQICPLARQRTNMAFTKVALSAALDELGIHSGSVKLVTGLPVRWYGDKEDLERQLKGVHIWQCDGQLRQVTVTDVLTVPQPVGSYFNAILGPTGYLVNDGLAGARVGVLDIGMHTTDFVLLDALRYIETASGSVETAMGTAYAQIARELQERFKIERTIHDVDIILRNGHTVTVFDREHNIADLIRPALDATAETVLGQVATAWGDGRDIRRVLVTGGGAIAMAEYVRARYPHAVKLPEPAMENVRGYLKYGRRKWNGNNG
jgi:plasmid segregation protein ParM